MFHSTHGFQNISPLLLLGYLLLLLLLLKILRILVRRKLGVRRVRSKVTLATVAVAVHGTRD